MSDQDVILDEFVEEGRLVTLAEVGAMLEEAQDVREELTYEQKIAMEHARRFARVDVRGAEAIVADIREALPEMEEKYAFRVADLVPQHLDDVNAIFMKSRGDFSEDDAQRVLDIVDRHYTA